MRRSSGRRGLVIACAIVVGLALATMLGVIALYPRIGAWFIENRVLPRVGARLGRTVTAGEITAYRGGAELRDLVVRGPDDADDAPLAHIGRVTVRFDLWESVTGDLRLLSVDVEGLVARAIRRADNRDNFRDIADKLGLTRSGATTDATVPDDASPSGLRPDVLTVTDASLELRDEAGGITIAAEDVDAVVTRDQPIDIAVDDISVTTSFGPAARVESLRATADMDDPLATAAIEIRGGAIVARRNISLSNISGRIESGDEVAELSIDLRGSYGGADEPLWSARGWIAPVSSRASVHVEADRFTLDRLDSILRESAVVDYDRTAIDVEMDITAERGKVNLLGTFEITDANIFHPMLAAKPVLDIDVLGSMSASFDTASRTLTVDEAELRARDVDYQIDGFLRLPGGRDPTTGQRRQHPAVSAHLIIPPIPCQTMYDGIPSSLMSYVTDYKLKGTFRTDLRVAIDWADLQATEIDGSVGIFKCKVIDEPDDDTSLDRLLDTFTHYVEVEVDKWIEFEIGPENLDFVPIWDISPHLTNSLMTTEDNSFYKHKGFIVREFRSALIKNLEAGRFRYGASSITMQTVKNVLLYREKTLSRKLQELFLTWHIENKLEKDRIFEIYLNAIEYGPGLYGIGPAARHYFGKHPRDLGPVEAAFFSSILPNPKNRYKQYCDDKLWRSTEKKIERILGHMRQRDRLTEDEYRAALATPLVFDRTEAPPKRECRRMVKKAIENARPTNPMAK